MYMLILTYTVSVINFFILSFIFFPDVEKNKQSEAIMKDVLVGSVLLWFIMW